MHHQVAIPVDVHSVQTMDGNATGYILVQHPDVATVTTAPPQDIKRESESTTEENIDEFLKATSIDDFLWYNCPKCDFRCKTSPHFIGQVCH